MVDGRVTKLVRLNVEEGYRGLGKVGVGRKRMEVGTGRETGWVGVELYLGGGNSWVAYVGGDGRPYIVDIQTGMVVGFINSDGKIGLTVGRGTENKLVISDPEVSREHVRLGYKPKGQLLVIEDLDSTNGTWARPLRRQEVIDFLELANHGCGVDKMAARLIKRMVRQGQVEAWTVDRSDWVRNPNLGKYGFNDMARTHYANELAVKIFGQKELAGVRNKTYTYMVTRKGELMLGDKQKSPREAGIKHRQLGRIAERWRVHDKFILGGRAVFGNDGEITIDNRSGSFHRLRQCSDRKTMQKLVNILAIKWGIGVTYRDVDEEGREIFSVRSGNGQG